MIAFNLKFKLYCVCIIHRTGFFFKLKEKIKYNYLTLELVEFA